MRRTMKVAGVAATAIACAVPAVALGRGPVGSWQFNKGSGTIAHDSSGNHNSGSLSGGVHWTQGRFRNALTFDGTGGGVVIPDNPLLEPQTLTVSAWVKAAGGPGAFRYIVAKGANACLTASWGLYTGPSGGLQFYVSSSQVSYVISPDAGTGVWDGNWHDVVGTYDGATVRLYLDGQQVGAGTPDTAPIAYGMPTSNDLVIGGYAGCPLPFVGSIDQVRVWGHALTPRAITDGWLRSRDLPDSDPFDRLP